MQFLYLAKKNFVRTESVPKTLEHNFSIAILKSYYKVNILKLPFGRVAFANKQLLNLLG